MSFKTYLLASLCLAGLGGARCAYADTVSNLGDWNNYTIYDPSGHTYVSGPLVYFAAPQVDGSLTQSFTDTPGDLVSLQFYLVTDQGGDANDFSVRVDGVPVYAVAYLPYQTFRIVTITFPATGNDTLALYGKDPLEWVNAEFPVASEAAPTSVLPTAAVSRRAVLDAPATAVTPEPSSMVLLGTGLLGMVGAVRRRLV